MRNESLPARVGAEPLLPMSVTAFAEGYDLARLRADLLAGLTVAIVALPLSMAIAIASGVGPERGLFTAIIGGFLISALGGSRYQIGGPAGAFIVLVLACVTATGVSGLVLATFLSGGMLAVLGLLRLGSTIRYMPYPVTVGFTSGIGVIIFASQIKDMAGLTLAGGEPGPILEKLSALWAARDTVSPTAVGVALVTVALIEALKRFAPRLPSLLLGIATITLAATLLNLPVETIQSRFGGLPRLLPAPALPEISLETVRAALPWAFSFTLLGAIESLLSAMVADGMSGTQHRSNIELVAQGVANMGAALFGGFCVTGTIARTATNVRAGASGPAAGMFHALFILGFMIVAAPLAGYIPLAALAGLLGIVAWNMIERHEMAALIRSSKGDALVLIVTFVVVVFRDLAEGIVLGFALGGLVFIRHMSEMTALDEGVTHARSTGPARRDVVTYHLRGAVFFGSVARLGSVLDRIASHPRAVLLDVSGVGFVDSTGARMIGQMAQKLGRRGERLMVLGATPAIEAAMRAQGLTEPLLCYCPDTEAALARLDTA
ncbi:SulP family inorganic anion transporter [Rhodobacter capsulatus]|uniref:SulP family inorganic anion transporter n=1 Tax=Rhodobacter capsulatus TaxID=1061 RepID=UPI0003D2B3E1|nr:SulP family inorganic anion transporter [Rhodobacter capsulatus]ETD82126.1 SulP family sulfate transporter [Rhodobacter capsulatus YW1]